MPVVKKEILEHLRRVLDVQDRGLTAKLRGGLVRGVTAGWALSGSDTATEGIDKLIEMVGGLDTKASGIDKGISKLEKRMDSVDEGLKANRVSIDNLAKRIDCWP